MEPRVVLTRELSHLTDRIELAGVHIARRRNDDGRLPLEGGERIAER